MRSEGFRLWRRALGLSQKDAAEALGLKRRMVQYYEKGERDGGAVEIPLSVRLACFALTRGVVDYAGPPEGPKRNEKLRRHAKKLRDREKGKTKDDLPGEGDPPDSDEGSDGGSDGGGNGDTPSPAAAAAADANDRPAKGAAAEGPRSTASSDRIDTDGGGKGLSDAAIPVAPVAGRTKPPVATAPAAVPDPHDPPAAPPPA